MLGVGAAGDRVTVGPVGPDQIVGRLHRRGRADDRRLLADREVKEAAGLGALVLTPRLLLEATDQRHRLEQLDRGLGIGQRPGGGARLPSAPSLPLPQPPSLNIAVRRMRSARLEWIGAGLPLVAAMVIGALGSDTDDSTASAIGYGFGVGLVGIGLTAVGRFLTSVLGAPPGAVVEPEGARHRRRGQPALSRRDRGRRQLRTPRPPRRPPRGDRRPRRPRRRRRPPARPSRRDRRPRRSPRAGAA